MNSTVTTPGRAINVPFHGAALYVVEHDGQPYTPVKPLAEGMKITWHGQHAKLKANSERWGILNLRIPTPSGTQEMICMPLRKLFGWLAGIETNKLKNIEARARVIQYQNECDDVLWQYWNEGLAVNPRAFHVGPNDTLTKEEQDTLRGLIEAAAHRLSSDTKEQGKFILKAWSKLKSHFGVSYREIPRQEFTAALSIVTRHEAEFTPITPIPNRDTRPSHEVEIAQAIDAARAVTLHVHHAILERMLNKDTPLHTKALLDIDLFTGTPKVSVTAIDPKAVTIPLERFHEVIYNTITVKPETLTKLIKACSDRLGEMATPLLSQPKLEPELRQRIA